MAAESVNRGDVLMMGVKGGGGLPGQNRNVRFTQSEFAVHAFEKKGPDGKTVIQRYPSATVYHYAFDIEDPVDADHVKGEQFLSVGRIPLFYQQQIGEHDPQRDPAFPGGLLPSPDGVQMSTAGPFVYLYEEKGIWEKCEWMLFKDELVNLASQDGCLDTLRQWITEKGAAALIGLRVHLGTKVKEESETSKKKKAAAAKQAATAGAAAKQDQERTMLVPDRVNQWPWQAAANQAVQIPAIQAPAAAPVPTAPQPTQAPAVLTAPMPSAPQQMPTVPTVPNPTINQSNGFDAASEAVKVTKEVVKTKPNSMLAVGDLATHVFPATNYLVQGTGPDGGKNRSAVMQLVFNEAWIAEQAQKGHWLYDPNGHTIMVG
jgi:hypothetical protein